MCCIALVRCVLVTHIESEQYNTWNKSTIGRKLLKMDVLTFEKCWAVNSEMIKQVTSSWSVFIQPNTQCFFNTYIYCIYRIYPTCFVLHSPPKHVERINKWINIVHSVDIIKQYLLIWECTGWVSSKLQIELSVVNKKAR